MRRITLGKIRLTITGETEKLPDLCGFPEGSAVICKGSADCESDVYERKLSYKYRVKKTLTEDIRLKAVVYRGERLENTDGKTLYCIGGGDPLAYITALSLCCSESADAFFVENAAAGLPGFPASAYGVSASVLMALTDYRINCLLCGKKYDAAGARKLRKEAALAVRNPAAVNLIDIAVKAASMEGFTDSESSVTQMHRAVSLILKTEERQPLPDGMVKLLSAFVLCGVYKQFILTDFGFVVPPDNNFRLEQAGEYFGIPELQLAATRFADMSEDRLKKALYSLKNNKIELLAEICFNEIVLGEALRRIKKMLPGCGYREFSALEPGDLRVALALAPDTARSGNSGLYSVMKSMGVLDGLL